MLPQLLGTMFFANPPAMIDLGRTAALRAVGATESDWNKLTVQGIPTWLVATTALVVGGVLAVRYMPDSWQRGIQRFGR